MVGTARLDVRERSPEVMKEVTVQEERLERVRVRM